jgi:transcriptional regulator with XRE-family HTH domain
MSIGKKIKELRKRKDVSQEELGKMIGAHLTNVSRYERDQQVPSADVIKKLAEVFDVSADYLLFDNANDMATAKVKDKQVLKYLEKIEKLPQEDKDVVYAIIKALEIKNDVSKISKKAG